MSDFNVPFPFLPFQNRSQQGGREGQVQLPHGLQHAGPSSPRRIATKWRQPTATARSTTAVSIGPFAVAVGPTGMHEPIHVRLGGNDEELPVAVGGWQCGSFGIVLHQRVAWIVAEIVVRNNEFQTAQNQRRARSVSDGLLRFVEILMFHLFFLQIYEVVSWAALNVIRYWIRTDGTTQ